MATRKNLLETALDRGLSVRRLGKAISNPRLILRNLRFSVTRTISIQSYIFVVGPPRSGTTLMQAVLRSHPRVAGFEDETRFFFRRNFTDLHLPDFSAGQIADIVGAARDSVDLFDRLAASLMKTAGANRFIEKTPEHVLRARWILAHFPQSRLVFMVRDPRDGYLSAIRNPSVKARTAEKYAALWAESLAAIGQVQSDPRLKLVRYEDFCRDPELVLRDVMTFLDLPFDPIQLDPKVYSRTTVSEQEGHQRLIKPISAETIGTWKGKIDPADRAHIEASLSREMAALGYDDAGDAQETD